MQSVRPKKALGQHFLTDLGIAARIADVRLVDNHHLVDAQGFSALCGRGGATTGESYQ